MYQQKRKDDPESEDRQGFAHSQFFIFIFFYCSRCLAHDLTFDFCWFLLLSGIRRLQFYVISTIEYTLNASIPFSHEDGFKAMSLYRYISFVVYVGIFCVQWMATFFPHHQKNLWNQELNNKSLRMRDEYSISFSLCVRASVDSIHFCGNYSRIRYWLIGQGKIRKNWITRERERKWEP